MRPIAWFSDKTFRSCVFFPLVLVLALLWGPVFGQTDTLRVATYNLLNFPGSTGTSRLPDFRKVISTMQPDVLVVQELLSESGLTTFLNDVMNAVQSEYQAAPFVDGPDTDNGLFYRASKVTLLADNQIATALRDISEYILEASGLEFRVYSIHLKAGTGTDNESKRLDEATILRNHLNDLPANSDFIVAGDFNIRNSAEGAFQELIGDQADNDGQLFDPIDQLGTWHDNAAFAAIHTQSTRTTAFGGGATGGLDDRFDLMLVSAAALSAGDVFVLTGSYAAYGNDGNHFNQAVNFATNTAVADSVADGLHNASDHLPVFADFVIGGGAPVEAILVNEVVSAPRQDWNDSAGGNGVTFDAIPGNGAVDADDEWIELYNNDTVSVDLTLGGGWTVIMADSTTSTLNFATPDAATIFVFSNGGSLANFQPGEYLVIGNPPGELDDAVFVRLQKPVSATVANAALLFNRASAR